jgi:ParB family chromosome partitioning protein
MTVDGGSGEDYQLLAGLRRLRAMEMLAFNEIAITIVAPADAEAALRIEISENEQREAFTFSEKMDFARLLEEIEREKSKERMSLGGKGGLDTQGKDERPYLEGKQSRDTVGEKIGMSDRQYSRAKHIAENAPDEVIEELDKGQCSINQTYKELRSKKSDSSGTRGALSKSDLATIERNKAFDAMSDAEKVVELQRQLKEVQMRANTAEMKLEDLKKVHHNAVYHKDGIINNLEMRLADAEARVEELERRL